MNVCTYLFSLTHDLVIVTGGHFIACNVRSTCDRGQKSQSLSGLKCCTYHTPLDYVTRTIRGLWHCHGTRQQFEDLPRIPSFKKKKLSPTAPTKTDIGGYPRQGEEKQRSMHSCFVERKSSEQILLQSFLQVLRDSRDGKKTWQLTKYLTVGFGNEEFKSVVVKTGASAGWNSLAVLLHPFTVIANCLSRRDARNKAGVCVTKSERKLFDAKRPDVDRGGRRL